MAHAHLAVARGLEGVLERLHDVAGGRAAAELSGDDVAGEVVEHGGEPQTVIFK